jgi:hypothetical protein
MDWNSSQTRRRFIGFGIAGAIPFVAGGRRLLAQRGVGPASGSAKGAANDRQTRDPVIDQVNREMGRLHTSIKKHGVRGEHVREFAGQVRVLIAHAEATGLDARVRSGMGAAIDRYGRDTVIDREMDPRLRDVELAQFGIDPLDIPIRARLERDRRVALVDGLLAGGVTTHLYQLSAARARAEEKAERLGAEALPLQRGIPAQDCWQSWGVIIDLMDGIASVFAWFAPELAAWFGLAGLMCECAMYVCCWGG